MKSFIEEVAATPGGEKIYDCIQCGGCTGVCPTANEMEYPVRKTIAMIRAGMRDESLAALCGIASAAICATSAVLGVPPVDIAHAFKIPGN